MVAKMHNQEWFTIADACRVLKVSRRTLYTYMETGRLPFYQVGGSGHRRIRAEYLEMVMVPAVGPNGATIVGISGQLGRHMMEGERKALIDSLKREQLGRQQLDRELEQLRHLKVWAGHPCALCHKPLQGVV